VAARSKRAASEYILNLPDFILTAQVCYFGGPIGKTQRIELSCGPHFSLACSFCFNRSFLLLYPCWLLFYRFVSPFALVICCSRLHWVSAVHGLTIFYSVSILDFLN
jgi:hypothetical protein